MQRKKILFVIPDFEINGATSSLVNFLSVIDRDRYNVSLFAMSHQGQGRNLFDKENILEENLLLSAFSGVFAKEKHSLRKVYFFIVKILSLILRNTIPILSLVYGHVTAIISRNVVYDTVIAFLEGPSTDFVSYFKKSRLVTWVHSDLGRAYEKEDNVFLENRNKIYGKFEVIVCVSKFTSNTFCLLFPTLNNRVKCIYNLINEKRIMELSEQSSVQNEDIALCFSIISIGRIDPVKRFSIIPKIAKELKADNIKFKWYIIGSGDKKEEKLIQNNIVHFNVKDYVFMLGKIINPYPYLAKSDLYISTSFSEACPMVFLEAKILEVPIVTANFPSAYEFVSKAEGAIVSLEDMARTIENLINNKEIYSAYKNNLRNNNYDNKSIIEEFNNTF